MIHIHLVLSLAVKHATEKCLALFCHWFRQLCSEVSMHNMFPLEKNSSPQPEQWLRKCNYLAWLAIFHTEVAVISPCYQPLLLLWVAHRVDSACQRTPSVCSEGLFADLCKSTTERQRKANLLTKQPHLLIERFHRFAALRIAVHFLTILAKKQPKETE